MTELDTTMLRRNLLIEQGIERLLDTVVKQANQTAAILKDYPRMEESQLRNLLNAAIESRSTEVVINFIRYQIARNGSAWGVSSDSFGHTVISDLNFILPIWHKQVLSFVTQQDKVPKVSTQDSEKVMVRLMQLYLGYLNRAFYYAKKTNDFDSLAHINAITLAAEQAGANQEAHRD